MGFTLYASHQQYCTLDLDVSVGEATYGLVMFRRGGPVVIDMEEEVL